MELRPLVIRAGLAIWLLAALAAYVAADEDLEKHLINGWLAEREKVRSGSYKFTNTVDWTGDEPREYPVNGAITVDFDYDRGATVERFDEKEVLAGYLLRRHGMFRADPAEIVTIGPNQRDARMSFEIDWRVMGLATFSQVEHSIQFSDVVDQLRSASPVQIEPLDDGRYRLVYEHQLPNSPISTRHRVIINERRGFSMDECVLEMFDAEQSAVFSTVRAQWERRGDAWIPVSMTFDEPRAFIRGHVELAWTAVNERPDVRRFQLDPLKLVTVAIAPGGTHMATATAYNVNPYDVTPSRIDAASGAGHWLLWVSIILSALLVASFCALRWLPARRPAKK